MRDYLEPMLGSTGATIAQFAITLVVIAAVILIVFWLIRTFTGGVGPSAIRGRQPRLGLIDALPIDQKRRLVLVRRDNIEHLILIGGATDIVVEGTIQRPSAAQRRAEAAARSAQPRRPAPPVDAEPLDIAGDASRTDAYQAEPQGEPAPLYEPAPEPVRAEPVRAEEPRVEDNWVPPVRVQRSREARASDPVAPEPAPEPRQIADIRPPVHTERTVEIEAEAVEVVQAETVIELPPPPPVAEAPAVVAPPEEPPARGRSFGSFFSSSRGSKAASEVEPPRRTEPPRRPLSRATPVAPQREIEPAVEAEVESEPFVEEPTRVEPVRAEPTLRAERTRSSTPRQAVPPAPPVAPPTLGEAPYGAPIADPDQPLRFEPIFDVDPVNEAEPVRPVRQSRETYAAPSVELGRSHGEETGEPAEAEDRQQGVGDLEKEMARLLGEISNTRRS